MKNYILYIVTLLFSVCSLSINAEEKNPFMFYGRLFSSSGDTLSYRILYPKGYDSKSKKYPLVVVLHGADAFSQGRSGYNSNLLGSPVAKLFQQQKVKDSFPAIVVFPECEKEDPWTVFPLSDSSNVVSFPESPEQGYSEELVERMIRYYVKHYPVDEKRIYIIGMGPLGGSGALDLAERNPKMFAAVVSICGAINPERTKHLKKVPIRLYASSSFFDVPITLVRDVFIELKTYGSTVVEPVIDLFDNNEKDCVKSAANTESFLKWIFEKKKK